VRAIEDAVPDLSCDHFISIADVRHMAQVLKNEIIRLHPEDLISVRLYTDQLKAQHAQVFYKSKEDLSTSRLLGDAFVLCIQTCFQLHVFERLGNGFIGIDATHNTTQYQDLLLFSIIARDQWGHGTYIIITVLLCWQLTPRANLPN